MFCQEYYYMGKYNTESVDLNITHKRRKKDLHLSGDGCIV